MADTGACLIIRSSAPDISFGAFVDRIADVGDPQSVTRLHDVECLEPGTVPQHTLVIDFADKAAARSAWTSMPQALIAAPAPPLVLLAARVPEAGFDDPAIPTRANAMASAEPDPVLLLIEGSATDQARMDRYRDIILPLMFERNAYYTVFELGGAIEVLSGEWDEAIFAISRWPTAASARDFWLCERYQRDAIPLRLDIGRFAVAMVPARDD